MVKKEGLKHLEAISLNRTKPGGLPAGKGSGPGLAVGRLAGFLKNHTAEMHREKRQGEKEGNRHVHVCILCLTTPPWGGVHLRSPFYRRGSWPTAHTVGRDRKQGLPVPHSLSFWHSLGWPLAESTSRQRPRALSGIRRPVPGNFWDARGFWNRI